MAKWIFAYFGFAFVWDSALVTFLADKQIIRSRQCFSPLTEKYAYEQNILSLKEHPLIWFSGENPKLAFALLSTAFSAIFLSTLLYKSLQQEATIRLHIFLLN